MPPSTRLANLSATVNFRRIRGTDMKLQMGSVLASVLGVAWLMSAGASLAQAPTVSAPAATTTPSPSTPPPDSTPDDYSQDVRVMNELARRKATLDRREHELELRDAQVTAAELLARREVGQLSSLRREVEKMITQQTGDATAELDKLAGLFSNMKPIQAAAILGKLDIPKAAAIVRRLDTRMAGPVLAAMDPAVAAGVTVELQRAHAPFQD
jgi:flagellar motility protein MotE (MotC chaperone)